MQFTFQNTTKIHFGEEAITHLSIAIPLEKKVLVVIGHGSVKRNGVLTQVSSALSDHQWQLFEGIEPNPQYETLMTAVHMIQKDNIDYVLAVGGGSVIDGCKFIVAAACTESDPWDICLKQKKVTQALPLGCVLTLPATGSESNTAAVISRGDRKLFFDSPLVRPELAILDPKCTLSLSERQTANGVADAFVHIIEQYLTYPVHAAVQDRFAEGLLLTLIEEGPKLLIKPNDMTARANVMWAATMALNGLIGLGVPQDWTTHMIGHEITALYGVDHARTLTIVLPAVMQVRQQEKQKKICQFGLRVWGVNDPDESTVITKTIEHTRDFFESIGMPTQLADVLPENEIEQAKVRIFESLQQNGRDNLGEHGDVTFAISEKIIQAL